MPNFLELLRIEIVQDQDTEEVFIRVWEIVSQHDNGHTERIVAEEKLDVTIEDRREDNASIHW